MAQTRLGRWSLQLMPFEVKAWVEPREPGRPRYEIGSFATPEAAQQACERDLARRLALQAEAAQPEPVRQRYRRRPVSLAKSANG
jgi:hypothetical protein